MATKKVTPTKAPGGSSSSSSSRTVIGRLQPSSTRLPGKPPVDYSKGGDDFRCPKNAVTTSSFGRQVLSFKHTNSSPAVRFPEGSRFLKNESEGIGPNSVGQMSSLGRQADAVKQTRRRIDVLRHKLERRSALYQSCSGTHCHCQEGLSQTRKGPGSPPPPPPPPPPRSTSTLTIWPPTTTRRPTGERVYRAGKCAFRPKHTQENPTLPTPPFPATVGARRRRARSASA